MNNVVEQVSNFKPVFNHFVGYEGAGKLHTAKSLSMLTGIPVITIRSHMDNKGSHPTWHMMLLYMRDLPVEFTDALLSPVGVSVCKAEEHEAPTTQQAQSALAKTMHKIAVALEDGQIDAREKAQLTPLIRETGQKLIALANQWQDDLKEQG